MRRSFSLALLAVLVILAVVVSTRYTSSRNRVTRRVTPASDSLARLDSAAKADAREAIDTMCFAARIGLPCSPQ
jgi:hypothetical protein